MVQLFSLPIEPLFVGLYRDDKKFFCSHSSIYTPLEVKTPFFWERLKSDLNALLIQLSVRGKYRSFKFKQMRSDETSKNLERISYYINVMKR